MGKKDLFPLVPELSILLPVALQQLIMTF